MIFGVLRETSGGERRVALIPEVLPRLANAGLSVVVEAGAGARAGFTDSSFEEKGARVVSTASEVFDAAEAIVQVHACCEPGFLRPGQIVIGLLDPWSKARRIREAAAAGVTAFALELMPRITRAQTMDVLSSMATIAGYKAVLLAAGQMQKIFPMLMTAAGTVLPARVFVLGAGVAGLQAIATARRLGAVVEAYDVRPSVKEQVESVGGKFVDLPLETGDAEDAGGYAKSQQEEFHARQRALLRRVVATSDAVITTAAIPGEKAPVLVTADMVEAMKPGSVIVDLAAERGGNCELSRPGDPTVHAGVTILAPLNLPSTVPYHSSQMYARNITAFLAHLFVKGELRLDMDDPIIAGTLVTRGGEVLNARIRALAGLAVQES